MYNEKIKIRLSDFTDCEHLFNWRSDKLSRSMFLKESTPSIEEHMAWFENSLCNPDRTIYIGEIGDKRIGMCRFDFIKSELLAEVSINMNPKNRSQGFGKRLLAESINYYLKKNKHNLLAKVKPTNLASLKIFEFAGFEAITNKKNVVTLVKSLKDLSFKEVTEKDADILFKLLKRRKHSISHNRLPTEDEHLLFVKKKPYRYWAVVLEDKCPIGTFYIQSDNSIGLNLSRPTIFVVSKIFQHIKMNFKPLKEIKSKVPSYFYVNISYVNKKLSKILRELNALPIQTSYKIQI